jgi:MFS family permease
LASGLLTWYLFYASQPYALEFLGKENLVWVAGAVTALFALSGVAGNTLVGRISRTKLGSRSATVLIWTSAGEAVCAIGLGVTGLLVGGTSIVAFVLVVVFLAGFGFLDGILRPVRQAYINDHIPSAQRATVLSFDSFFSDIGAVAGQVGLGYAAQIASKAVAYTIGGVVYLVSVPLYRRAGRASDQLATVERTERETEAEETGSEEGRPPEASFR